MGTVVHARRVKWYSNPQVVAKFPIASGVLLEWANVSQLWRMWSERSSEDQSLIAWLSVFVALALYWNFYRVCTPDQPWPRRVVVLSLATNVLVWLTVIYFRWFYV